MTYFYARDIIDAHLCDGDCDSATCPLCELDGLACEWCDESTDEDGRDNACGIAHCLDCVGRCRSCQDDMKEQADL